MVELVYFNSIWFAMNCNTLFSVIEPNHLNSPTLLITKPSVFIPLEARPVKVPLSMAI